MVVVNTSTPFVAAPCPLIRTWSATWVSSCPNTRNPCPFPQACVTGANGYLGAYIIQMLLSYGYTVIGTVRHANLGMGYGEWIWSGGGKCGAKDGQPVLPHPPENTTSK